MANNKIKAKWAGKLLRSTNFALVTDKESVVFVEHTNPEKFDDVIKVTNQLTALRKFHYALQEVITKFEENIAGREGKKISVKKQGRATKVRVSRPRK